MPTETKLQAEFVTGPQVQARYQKSHVTIWRWVKDADLNFPKPIQINRLNYWRLADLVSWEASQVVAS
jgi:predicted DNA-binding transcriptional regulator AlpA